MKKAYIIYNKKDLRELLNKLYKKGYRWYGGRKDFEPDTDKAVIYVTSDTSSDTSIKCYLTYDFLTDFSGIDELKTINSEYTFQVYKSTYKESIE